MPLLAHFERLFALEADVAALGARAAGLSKQRVDIVLDPVEALAEGVVGSLDVVGHLPDLADEFAEPRIVAHNLKLQIGRVARGDDPPFISVSRR
jgi:phosphohistidine phosphatase SixA